MAFPLNVTVASAVRTAVGRANKGALKHTRPDDLAAAAMRSGRCVAAYPESLWQVCASIVLT